MNGILRHGIKAIATLVALCLCSTAQSALIPAVATNVDLAMVASNAPAYSQILLMPGTYNVTNAIRLKEGQSLVGQGYGNTFLKFWGYTVDSVQTVGDQWVCVLLNTNTVVSDMDIRCMVASNNVFQACIGFLASAGGGSGTNFLVERVSMHGDTDNFYQDNGGQWVGTISDCLFDSKWDTCVFNVKENSVLSVVNPFMTTVGPSISKGASGSALPAAFRVVASGTATNRALRVTGGFIYSSAQLMINNGVPTTFIGTRFLCPTNGALVYGSANFVGCDFAYSKITSLSGGQASSTSTISGAVTLDGLAEELIYGNPSIGASYYSTNLNAVRVFDGFGWTSVSQRANTNQLLVTGDGTAAYNGVYTWKSGGIGTSFFSYTNYAGKFLVGSTNAQADAPVAISDTESISNAAEHVLNGTGLIERGWDTAAIRVRWIQGAPSDFYVDTDRAYGVTNGSYVCRSAKTLTKSSATTLFNFTIATNRTVSMRIFATIRCNNGTDYQVLSDELIVNAVSKNGVITTGVSTVSPTITALSTGTFTDLWTAVANANLSVDVKVNAVPSLTPGTLVCNWRVDVDSDSTVVITP